MSPETSPNPSQRPLRIQVDARLLQAGGIGRYIREITRRWLARPDIGALHFFGRPAELEPFLAEWDVRGVADVTRWADGPYSPVAQLRWPILTLRAPWAADITFLPHYDVPLLCPPHPFVVCVHDLIHFQRPEGFPDWKRALAMTLMRRALEGATAIVTVSETSGHAICNVAPGVGEKIEVVKNGVGEEFRPLSPMEAAAADRKWGHLRPFALCVGPDKPHKNLSQAVEVLTRLPADEGWRLVLVGPSEAERDRLVAASDPADVGSRVIVTGRVTDEDLRSLYGLAAAVLVPSLLEGFGLPVLEARACGARVLMVDRPWTRELAQPGVVLMPNWSPLAWAREIRAARSGVPALARNLWSWDETAERTFEVLVDAAKVGEQRRGF